MFGYQVMQEEEKLDDMQRIWKSSRRTAISSSIAFFEKNQCKDMLASSIQTVRNNVCIPSPREKLQDIDSDNENIDHQEQFLFDQTEQMTKLDGSLLNDLPAHYVICSLQSHQLPVCGIYIDERIVPGFKYKVRPLPPVGEKSTINKCLFKNRALRLHSIGRGYARRLTFEAEDGSLNSNDNYFYSDNRTEGYAFELEIISDGDKFTIFNMNQEAQGTLEILNIEGPQIEISSSLTKKGMEKLAHVKFTGKVEFYDTGVAKPILLTGKAVSIKAKGQNFAQIVKVVNVHINKQRFTLLPGIQNNHRRVTVRGLDIGDVPTRYTMTGLEPYEIPVVGTYVDPRVIPGFIYMVRPNNRKNHLFGGRALMLLSIGMGYAKRLTFEPDSLNYPENYLWSDNHPDGLGLQPRAVCKGTKFNVIASNQIIGEATVFRDDKAQYEENTIKKVEADGIHSTIEKHIHIDVICHIQLLRTGGATNEKDSYMMRISGVAIVRKESNAKIARVVEVGHIGLDSELYVLFCQNQTEIKFLPIEH